MTLAQLPTGFMGHPQVRAPGLRMGRNIDCGKNPLLPQVGPVLLVDLATETHGILTNEIHARGFTGALGGEHPPGLTLHRGIQPAIVLLIGIGVLDLQVTGAREVAGTTKLHDRFVLDPLVPRYQAVIALGILGGGSNELELPVQPSSFSPPPSDHGHKIITVAGMPVEVPEHLDRRLRILGFDVWERKPSAVKPDQGALLVQVISTRHVLAPVCRRRVGPRRSNLYVHIWIEVKLPGRLWDKGAEAINVLDRQMLPRLERGGNCTILLEPVTHSLVALVLCCPCQRGDRQPHQQYGGSEQGGPDTARESPARWLFLLHGLCLHHKTPSISADLSQDIGTRL